MLSLTQFGKFGGPSMPPEWLLKGLPEFGSGTSGPAPRLFRARRDRKKLRIANFVGLSGPSGIWGPASINSTLLGVSEINRRGGILGREIEVAFHDTGGDIDDVTRTAADIVASEDADLVMGSHISAVRVALRKVVAGHIPYLYTPVYEGGERTPGVMAIGETPGAQWRPAIEWLANTRQASNWYLIGSDYVWPWLSHKAIKKYIADAGGRVVGEEFVPIGEHNHSSQIERIRAARPDVVLITLIGADSVVFNRAFAEQGLGSSNAPSGRRDGRDRAARDRRRQYRKPVLRIRLFHRQGLARERCLPRSIRSVVRPPRAAARLDRAVKLRRVALSGDGRGARGIAGEESRCSRLQRMWTIRARGAPSASGAATPRMPIYLAAANGLDFRLIKQF